MQQPHFYKGDKMSKRIHLICNAHLDPVWQWEWEEGAAEALSTFRIAADFCEEYDKFVFCHNEALLYQWIEEYDGDLFKKIQKLVAQGKWHIMGGWQLQPDCNMPGGEFFVRQILSGRKYFLEKFGKVPTTAINFDPFGHSRGLVQIMKKSGYDGYIFMRPDAGFLELPAEDFTWKGYDGSEITAVRLRGSYKSEKGLTKKKILEYIENCEEDDFTLCMWGIGNHGGGPSKIDLEDVFNLTEEKKNEGVILIQSTPEEYIDEVNEKRNLPVFDKSLNSWAPGCYTSQIRVKQKLRKAENEYYFAESVASHAAGNGLLEYPEKELAQALYDIMFIQFHDTLPGSDIEPGEEMSLRTLDHALEILSRIKAKAFFALCAGQKKAPEDKIPIFIYNPYPYKLKCDNVCEFMLWDQVWEDIYLKPVIYNDNGDVLPSQCEKEESSVPLEWRKRVVFNAELEPMSINRFECGFEKTEKPVPFLESDGNHYIFKGGKYSVKINKSTGLIDEYSVDGENFVKNGAFSLEVWNDNFDPWYMEKSSWTEKTGEFLLLSREKTTEFCCVKNSLEPVHVIESGDVRSVVEAIFGYNNSTAVVKYILSQNEGLKIDVRVLWSEKQKLVKMNVPCSFAPQFCIGEHPYGREEFFNSIKENVSQKYVAAVSDKKAMLAINNGTYASSFNEKTGELKLTLLRSPAYCAHPVGDRTVVPQDRYSSYIDQGQRDFGFMFDIGSKKEVLDNASRNAQHYNIAPMSLSLYPSKAGEKPKQSLVIKNNDIINVTAYKKSENGDGYIVRLFNPVETRQTADICYYELSENAVFAPFEIKSFRLSRKEITETNLMENLI